MSERILLLLAYHFPPENTIGAARPYRFFKYAPLCGWKPAVVTAAPQEALSGKTDVHYVADPAIAENRSAGWYGERILRRFVMPIEAGLAWSKGATRFCERYIDSLDRSSKIVLFSTFPPLGPHLAAMKLAKARGLSWIADFRDPYVSSRRRNKLSTPLSLALAKRFERQIIETASLIVTNTDASGKELEQLYPAVAGKIRVIWNGYDPEEELTAPLLPLSTRKTMIHTGALYGGRHTGPILASFSRLIQIGALSPDSILVRFVGESAKGSLIPEEVVESGVQQGWIELMTRTIPQAQARELCQQAESLLLIQPHSDTQVPGKLFEYIRIGRPIFAFIRKDSPIEKILNQCGIPNVCIYPEHTEEQVDNALLKFLSIGPGPWLPAPWFLGTFDGREQAKLLCSLADQA